MSSNKCFEGERVGRSGWRPEKRACCALLSAALATFAGPAFAQTNFYAGKTITIEVGATAGGGYDVYARAIAPFLSAHIPGKPNVIVQTMPGAGGFTAVRYLNAGGASGRHRHLDLYK
jgi:tripartite-type tricarboxylate transporter receptor subunit TctC